jgi:FixJ family two-component response regulator
MPGLISLDFQGRRYKTEHPVLIIFITGHGDLTMGVRFMKKCALDFFIKADRRQAVHRGC